MTNAQFKQWKPSADYLDRVWDAAWTDWRKEQQEKARTVAAMLAAGQQKPKEAAK